MHTRERRPAAQVLEHGHSNGRSLLALPGVVLLQAADKDVMEWHAAGGKAVCGLVSWLQHAAGCQCLHTVCNVFDPDASIQRIGWRQNSNRSVYAHVCSLFQVHIFRSEDS
jgi:hypothetical protein